jgi:putative NADH-flavin reductase
MPAFTYTSTEAAALDVSVITRLSNARAAFQVSQIYDVDLNEKDVGNQIRDFYSLLSDDQEVTITLDPLLTSSKVRSILKSVKEITEERNLQVGGNANWKANTENPAYIATITGGDVEAAKDVDGETNDFVITPYRITFKKVVTVSTFAAPL